MRIARGNIVSFTPDSGWEVIFGADGEQWAEPVIGWAVVALGQVAEEDGGGVDTDLQPVILPDGKGEEPQLLRHYREEYGEPEWTLSRA
ncbi:hypothetical protein, partial [Nocardiopsis synnemataformans]|uniref:hypothetical protein n=1 Tax=Nocardiopsis synnemataformans TaxID=61305 RepID=UPI003EBCD1E1